MCVQISRRASSRGGEKGGSLDTKRSRLESQPPPPLLRLDVLSGPSSGRDITIENPSRQVRGHPCLCLKACMRRKTLLVVTAHDRVSWPQ